MQEVQFLFGLWGELSCEGKAEKGAPRGHNLFEVWIDNSHYAKE